MEETTNPAADQIQEICDIMHNIFKEKGLDPRQVIFACECFVANICYNSDLSYKQYSHICQEATKSYRPLWGE